MRKGQAAMEFLMTYGWAILIVIAVVAALFAMGVFKLPTGGVAPCSPCFAPATGIAYKDHNADNLVIVNGRSANITIQEVRINGVSQPTFEVRPFTNKEIPPQANATITIDGGFAGTNVNVEIIFTDKGTGLNHTATATLHGA